MILPPATRLTAKGLEVRVKLTPKSSSDQVLGLCDSTVGPAIAARVRAIPSDGEANDAAVRLIADWLGLAKSSISLTAGQKSRIKTLTISGETGGVIARLGVLLELSSTKNQKTKGR